MSDLLKAGERIQHFVIDRVIGRGGMGTVYLARDEKLGRPVALKLLADADMQERERHVRFLREARAAAAIRHPNVATIFEVGQTEIGIPFIAMEYCQGPTLTQLIRAGSIEAPRLLSIARQIAEGLAAAHRNGVIHRDVKSANVIVEADGTVKILDFGLAKLAEADLSLSQAGTWQLQSSVGQFFGTVPYLSPEQARGLPADARSDLFSFGVVLYEMATGTLPFDAETPLGLLEQIRDEEPRPFEPRDPALPQEYVSVVSRLLQKQPEKRYGSADEVVAALAAVETNDRPSRFGTTLRERSTTFRTRPSRRHLVTVSAAGLVLAVASVAAYFVAGQRESPEPPARSATTPIRSLAVLPLRNLSGASQDEFLAVGIADALVTRLQQIPSLRVRPTSAVLPYKKQETNAQTAGAELKVDGVLEGHFLTSGNVVRVNLQLTDSRSGYSVWAGTVDGDRSNLITLMDAVSARTAAALDRKLTENEGRGRSEPRTSSPQAFEAYMRARALSGTHDAEQHQLQIRELQRAIELDPQFAAAYAELALALALGQARGLVREPGAPQRAERYARQAVRLDPNLPEAHLALGRTLVRLDRYRESVRENLAALRLNPGDPNALFTMISYLVATGDLQKVRCVGDRFVQADPSSNDARTRGYWNVNALDADGAVRLSALALGSRETELAGRDIRAQGYLLRGQLEAAEVEARAATLIHREHYIPRSLRAMIAAARGDRPTAEKELVSMQHDIDTNHWATLRAALTYARLGDRRRAADYVEQAVRLGNHSWYFLANHPWLQPLQSEPAFQRTLTRVRGELDDVRDDVLGVYELICPEPAAADAPM